MLLTKTSTSALRALIQLGQQGPGVVLSPRRLAESLAESPTYMAKVCRLLVKAGILRAERGSRGGVLLGRHPREISLLSVVEACQGAILGSYCRGAFELKDTCAYHQATVELHQAIVKVLSRWTLAHLLKKPCPSPHSGLEVLCVLAGAGHRRVGAN